MKQKCGKWFMLAVFLWQITCLGAAAEESKAIKEDTRLENGIALRAILPENQYDEKKTYFDLMMEPGGKQKIQIEILNKQAEEIEIETAVRSAYTNEAGEIDYGERTLEADATLLHNMEDLISTLKRVKVAGGETYVLDLDVTMPEEEFDGILAGGITVKLVDEEETESDQRNNSIEVMNKYSYVIGIILRENENEVKPKLNLRYITADNTGPNSRLRINLQNAQPMAMEGMTIEAQITEKGDKKTLYETKAEEYRMAPNTNFEFLVEMDQKLEAGKYLLYFNATSGKRSWNWKEEFTIEEKGIIEEKKDQGTQGWIYAAIAAAIALITASGVVITAKKKGGHTRENHN